MGPRFVHEALHDTQSSDIGCMKGTRVHLLSKCMLWATRDPIRIFWLAGLAGTGKTSIALTLCRLLQDDARVLLGGAFFCSRTAGKEERTDARCILPTLAFFLAERCPEFATSLENELSLSGNPRAAYKDASVQMRSLLQLPLASLKSSALPIVFVIDALDECVDGRQVEQVLQAIVDLACDATVKFIVTSRPETPIVTSPISSSDLNTILRLHTIDKAEVTVDIRHYISEAFSTQRLSTTWYTEADITELAARADGLFIFASTMIKYVLAVPGPGQRTTRLQTTLSAGYTSPVAMVPLDEMYNFVLTRASDGTQIEASELAATLDALACVLSARALLSVAALADLLGRDVEDLRGSLERLYAVLYVPEKYDDPSLRTVHASFGDYLFERAATSVRIARSRGDEILTRGCFSVLLSRLVFNVSDSKSSYEPTVAVTQQSRPDTITLSLEYACLHWIHHLSLLPESSDLYQEVCKVFCPRVLFWIEAMSTLHVIERAIEILNEAAEKIRSVEISQFLRDAHAFLVSFREPIAHSAPHIYLSALPFERKSSLIYQTFAPLCTGIVTVEVSGIDSNSGPSVEQMVQPLAAHDAPVNSIAASPDGSLLVSGSSDCSIRIWNARTGQQRCTPLLGHTDSVLSVAIGRDGRFIASGSQDCTVRLWDLSTGAVVGEPLLLHQAAVSSVLFSPNSLWIASGSWDGTVCIWDVEKRRPSSASPLRCSTDVTVVAWSRDGETIASGDRSGQICFWRAETGDCLHKWRAETFDRSVGPLRRHDEGISSLEFSSTGTRILCSGYQRVYKHGGELRFWSDVFVSGVWDIVTGKQTWVPKGIGRPGRQNGLTYSPDNQIVVGCFIPPVPGGRGSIGLWDAGTGQNIATVSTQGDSAGCVTFTPDGHSIAAGCGTRIRVWDVRAARSTFSSYTQSGDPVAALTRNYFGTGTLTTNWIKGPSNELLLWVPPEYQPYLQGGALRLVIGSARVVISRDPKGMHYGQNWTKCWRQNAVLSI